MREEKERLNHEEEMQKQEEKEYLNEVWWLKRVTKKTHSYGRVGVSPMNGLA